MPPRTTAVRSQIPEVAGLPVVGCAPWMAVDGPGFFLRTARAHGPLFRVRIGSGAVTVVCDPEDIRHILHERGKNYVRGRTVDLIRPLLGDGLALADGDLWLRQRRTMQPAFNRGHVSALAANMARVIARSLARIPVGSTVDAHAFFTALARDVIVESMFSDSVASKASGIDEAFSAVTEFAARRAFSPVKIPLRWPLPENRRFLRAIETIDRVVADLVRRRREGERKADLLDALLEAKDPETGEHMDEKQLRDELVTVFFAGHETTANLLTWVTVELSNHRGWAARMRDEVLSVAGDRPLSAEDIPSLPVTNAIVREALRLHPPAWIFAREPLEDDSLRGFYLEKSKTILLSPYVAHRLEERWPDPDAFDPERFLRDDPFTLGGGRDARFLPFGAGPHVCIGNHFAITEAIIALGALARHGLLVLTHPERVATKVAATLSASNTDATVRRW